MTVAADPDILDRTLEYSLRAVRVFRELESESLYWLQLIGKAAILPAARLSAIVDETDQLTRILAAILVKSKRAK